MDVSIIIVNYNTLSFLINVVDSINILVEKYGEKIIYLKINYCRHNKSGRAA